MRLTLKNLSLIAVAVGLAGAASMVGCSSESGTQQEETGSLAADLQIKPGVKVSTLTYTVTKGQGTVIRSGTLNVAGSQSSAQFNVAGLTQGVYRIAVSGKGSDGKTYSATTLFVVGCGETTTVSLLVDVEHSKLDVDAARCPTLSYIIVNPTTAPVGGKISLKGFAFGHSVKYAWSATAGTFASPTSASTQYTCTVAGTQTLTLAASNDGLCTVSRSVKVTCTSGGGGGSGGAPSGGASSGGASSGGAHSGGASSGGASSGGASSGGASSGGASSGGAHSGGASSGGAHSGGASSGGASSGGASSGGASSGGASSGGASSGGASSGGASSGGATSGGATSGGATSGGATSGGATSGGATSGGATSGGATSGGATSGGATSGGATSGGASSGGAGGATCPQPVNNINGTETCTVAYQTDDCGANCSTITGPVCLACEASVGDGTADCGFATGTDAAGTPRASLCNQAEECMRQTNCAKENNLDCYCGNTGASCFSTDASGKTLGNGACKAAIEAGLETTNGTDIQLRFGDPTFGGGLALLRLATDHDFCVNQCFR